MGTSIITKEQRIEQVDGLIKTVQAAKDRLIPAGIYVEVLFYPAELTTIKIALEHYREELEDD